MSAALTSAPGHGRTLAEHLSRNWLMILFASLLIASVITMLTLDEPRHLTVIVVLFLLAFGAAYTGVTLAWFLLRRNVPARARARARAGEGKGAAS